MSAADSATKDSHEKRNEKRREKKKGKRRRRREEEEEEEGEGEGEEEVRRYHGGMVMTVADIPSCCRFNRLVLIGGYETCHRS